MKSSSWPRQIKQLTFSRSTTRRGAGGAGSACAGGGGNAGPPRMGGGGPGRAYSMAVGPEPLRSWYDMQAARLSRGRAGAGRLCVKPA